MYVTQHCVLCAQMEMEMNFWKHQKRIKNSIRRFWKPQESEKEEKKPIESERI